MGDDFVPDIQFNRRRVSVRTAHGIDIARKLARIKLLDKRINVDEFMTSLIFFTDCENGEKDYLFSW